MQGVRIAPRPLEAIKHYWLQPTDSPLMLGNPSRNPHPRYHTRQLVCTYGDDAVLQYPGCGFDKTKAIVGLLAF